MASNSKQLKVSDQNAGCSTTNETKDFNFKSNSLGDIVNTKAFVDKTMMIKEIFEGSPINVITAPSLFGKTINMDMIKVFFEIQVDDKGAIIEKKDSSNYRIFKDNNLLIFQDTDFFEKHFATYPVIYVSFKSIGDHSYEEIISDFTKILYETYSKHMYLLESKIWSERDDVDIDTFKMYSSWKKGKVLEDEYDIQVGLLFLAKCLFYHFDDKKVFVLIDEYDALHNNTLSQYLDLFTIGDDDDVDHISDTNQLIAVIFTETLEGNEFVERALLTGVSYFASVALSHVTNVEKYMFLDDHPFVKYYGLTESEIDALLSKFEINEEDVNAVKSNYGGYTSIDDEKIYSLWSVLVYLHEKEIKPYEWFGTSHLTYALRIPSVQFAVEKILQDSYHLNTEIFHIITPQHVGKLRELVLARGNKNSGNPDLYLNYLLQHGYLTYKITQNGETSVTIPNNIIRSAFTRELNAYYGKDYANLEECTIAFDQISVSNNSSFQNFINKFRFAVRPASSGYIIDNKRICHSLVFCVVFRSEFQVCDVEFLGDKRRPDLIAMKGKNGFMIQVTVGQNSRKALQQIIAKKYYSRFDTEEFKDLENKVYFGININKGVNISKDGYLDCHASLGVLVNTLDISKAQYFTMQN